MVETPKGVKIVGAEVAAAIEREAAEQLDLLASLPTRFEPGTEAHTELIERTVRQYKGRPRGAQNIATRDMVAFIRRRYGDPMEESARWLAFTPEAMAAELKITLVEAWDRQQRIREFLTRFCYAPLAATDAQGNVIPPTFNMQLIAGAGAAVASGAPPWAYLDGSEAPEQANGAPAPKLTKDD
jgi:hypothetical protein